MTESRLANVKERDEAKESDQVSLLDLLLILAERKRLILWVTGASALLAIIVSLLLPARYTAAVTILPPQQNTSMSSALASQLGSMGGLASLAGSSLGLKNPNDTFVGMLRSRTVEDNMIQHFGLMKEYRERTLTDARKRFEDETDVDGETQDRTIRISVEDYDPNRAAELANGYVDQFRKLSESLAITEAAQRRLFFEKQLEQAKNNLASAEEALKATEQQTGLIQLDSQARALIESAASIRAQIAAKEVQMESIRTYATSENSQLVQVQQELATLRSQLAKLGGSEGQSDESLLVPKGQVPEASLEYVRKLRDVKYEETIFEILARQFEMAKLDEAKEGALIQVVDPAVPPEKRSSPKRSLIVLGTTLIALLTAICYALAAAGMMHLQSEPVTHAKLLQLRRMLF